MWVFDVAEVWDRESRLEEEARVTKEEGRLVVVVGRRRGLRLRVN